MKLLLIIFLWVGTAAVRLGNQPADGNREYTVSVQVIGPVWEQGLTIAIAENGRVKTELAHNVRVELLKQPEGGSITVGTPSDNYNACTYKAGDMPTHCFIGKHEVFFRSQEEVEDTLQMSLQLTRNGQGNAPPFEVKVDNVVIWKESSPIAQGQTWWRMIDVAGAGVTVTLLFPSTSTECTYTTTSSNDKKTCEIEGCTTEFETMVSTPFTGDWLAKFKTSPTARWAVRLKITGSGPPFDIFSDHDKLSTENHAEHVSLEKEFDARVGRSIRFVFNNYEEEDIYFRIGKHERIVNAHGFNFEMETILKSE